MSQMTPRRSSPSSTSTSSGRTREARGRHRAAQPLAAPAGARAAAPGDHAEEHPDDRPDRRRQDRDRATPGAARRRAVRQGRGDQVHRGRLRRPRRRHDRARPGRRRGQADARGARRARCATARPTPPRSASSTCCCRRRARSTSTTCSPTDSATRQKFRKMLREGQARRQGGRRRGLGRAAPQMEIMAPPGMEDLTAQLQGMFQQLGGGRRKVQKHEGRRRAEGAHRRGSRASSVNDDEIKAKALASVEQNGIVFLDEIDKIASRSELQGADVSRQGVQRDLLPLVEGTTVSTKYGMVRTDHVLFIASGAFHLAKPSDLIPELQGRFPIRVELASLVGRRFRADPHRHRRVPRPPVRGAAAHRERRARVPRPTPSGGSPRSRSPSTRSRRTSARGASTR